MKETVSGCIFSEHSVYSHRWQSRRCWRTYTLAACIPERITYKYRPTTAFIVHGAATAPRCCCNLAPSSPVDILVRPGGSDNATNYDRRPSFCCRGTSCEQSSSIRHWLMHIFLHF